MKKIVLVVLVLFISLGAYFVLNNKMKGGKGADIASNQQAGVVDAIYLHGTNRCYTCNLMEKYIREVLTESFPSEFSNGQITFNAFNIDEDKNDHFIDEYQIEVTSLILSLKKNGKEEKYVNCKEIWKLSQDKTKFKEYVKEEIKHILGT